MTLNNFDPHGIVGSVTSYRKHVGDILVPVHVNSPKVGVPVKAKLLATKYLDATRPRAVVQEIYAEGLAIEVGVVLWHRDRDKLNEYTVLMYEEDMYFTTKKLNQEGDGVLLT